MRIQREEIDRQGSAAVALKKRAVIALSVVALVVASMPGIGHANLAVDFATQVGYFSVAPQADSLFWWVDCEAADPGWTGEFALATGIDRPKPLGHMHGGGVRQRAPE